MDKAALGIYKRSLGQPDMAHAVCCTTLNTTLVSKQHVGLVCMTWHQHINHVCSNCGLHVVLSRLTAGSPLDGTISRCIQQCCVCA